MRRMRRLRNSDAAARLIGSIMCSDRPSGSRMATDLQVALRKVASINPATGEVLREVDCASDAEVQQAVSRARSAQKQWAVLDVGVRIEVLRQFQRTLHD